MLKIGKLTDYAMLILGELASVSDEIVSTTALADKLHLPVTTVSKVLKLLLDASLVVSLRGADGGYRLARPAKHITLVDVIEAMEGDFALTECCEKAGQCSIDASCTLQENWLKINKLIHRMLGQWTILDIRTPMSDGLALMIKNAESGHVE